MFALPQTLVWHNQAWPVPDLDQLEEWVIDSVCETPDGDCVARDHPDSWYSCAPGSGKTSDPPPEGAKSFLGRPGERLAKLLNLI